MKPPSLRLLARFTRVPMTSSSLSCSTAAAASRRFVMAAVAAISLELAIRDAGSQPAELPTPQQAQEVCRHVATRGPAILPELVANGVLDANNDGVENDVRVGARTGTMRGEDLEMRS